MVRARVAAALVAVAVASAVGAVACFAQSPAQRLERAVAAMERLEGYRFELVARVEASGDAGTRPIVDDIRMTGEYAAPDRLHVAIDARGARTHLVIVGRRQWVDEGAGYHQTIATPVGPLRDARATLTFLRGGGEASAAGLGFARGTPTSRLHLELSAGDLAARQFEGIAIAADARGRIDVEVGLADDLIRRQVVDITSGIDGAGSGLGRVRTTYVVEYWAHGERQDVREPE